jgi:flavin reductase (DIM6/NTAB) family NADH-FMN oxidoreductase RutF
MISPATNSQPEIDPLALRGAFGTFVTGVTVVTTRDADGAPRGMTANSFTSVSLDPPLLLVCVGRQASSFAAFSGCMSFAVNILHEQQTSLSAVFASKKTDKFEGVSFDTVNTGAPILANCLSWFDCTTHQRIEAGDHIILIGRIQAFGTSPAAPLGFCRGRYAEIKEPLPPGWSPARNMIIAYLIEADRQILLRSAPNGRWTLPVATGRRRDGTLELDAAGDVALTPDTTFLYSIFDVAETDPGYIVYRGRLAPGEGAQASLPPGHRFFDIADLPFDAIAERDIAAVLKRYIHEREQNCFGIYMDAVDGGRVAMLSGADG